MFPVDDRHLPLRPVSTANTVGSGCGFRVRQHILAVPPLVAETDRLCGRCFEVASSTILFLHVGESPGRGREHALANWIGLEQDRDGQVIHSRFQ